ncbi:MAG TPA: type II toxin-antitoxin system RelE/ParE family toxin [Chthonomonadaceae bacterium]|nr:type II toxin-antitoxin system RelE/ParE family toxin [Chthonomonadaceae bacterium]
MAEEYAIILQPEAYEGMESAYEFIEQQAPEYAHEWAIGLMEAIDSLKTFPGRCAIAPENEFFPQEIRQLLYGKGRGVYRVLFAITGDTVSVLHIRHSAQDTLKPDEM